MRPDVDWYIPADCYPGGGAFHRITCRVRVMCRLPRTLRCWGMLCRRRVRRSVGRRRCSTLLDSAVAEDDVITPMGETIACLDTSPTIIPPPPGFSKLSWPYEDWSVSNEQSRFTFTIDSLGCVPDISAGRQVVVPSLPLSPIDPNMLTIR